MRVQTKGGKTGRVAVESQQNRQWCYQPRFVKYSVAMVCFTRGSAMAEGLRDALVSRNSATTKYPYRMALFA